MPSDKKEAIHKKAYEIWEAEGRPDGKHEEHWSRAEQEVDAPKEAAAKPAAPRAKKAAPKAEVEAPKPAPKAKAAPKAAAKPKAPAKG
ncbi:MAG: DUF2934 domain-containing protein [Rhodospirillaceae bacterium]|nr:DUF2934 domain-containing protein [Rhodospirillaceae bacterium]